MADRHGAEPSVFARELRSLEALTADGLVHVEGWRVTVPEACRVFVRSGAAVFDEYLAPSGSAHHAMAV